MEKGWVPLKLHQNPMEPSPTGSGECKPSEVDLSGLTLDQQQEAVKMLYKEADDNIRCIEELQMDIQLTDNQPIHKKYLSIPRPLYPEVKSYIEDLLNRNFI